MPDAADVMRVAELDGLLDEDVLVRVEAAEMHQPDHCAETGGEDAKCNDAEPRIDIGMAMKELTHRVGVRVVPSS